MPSKKTIAEKILSAKSGIDAYAGDIVVARIDRAFSHDANRPLPSQVLRDMGGKALFDHGHYYLFGSFRPLPDGGHRQRPPEHAPLRP